MDDDKIIAEMEMGFRVDEILEGEKAAATGKIAAEQLSDAEALELKSAAERHLVSVDPSQPSCCIDGRKCVHTLAGESTSPRPSVAGGALLTSYAAAELIGWFGDDTKTKTETETKTRLARVNTILITAGITVGNHCDESAVENKFTNPDTGADATGCGAGDRLPEILRKPYEESAAVAKLVEPLMGGEYDVAHLRFVNQAQVSEKTANWNPRDVINVIGNENNVEVLASPHDKPNHGHAEVAVLFNYKENTTLDRDAFVAETDKQIFVVDMWYIDKLARAMANGPDAKLMYPRLKHAMVAYQVATYLALCDGSQRLMTTK